MAGLAITLKHIGLVSINHLAFLKQLDWASTRTRKTTNKYDAVILTNSTCLIEFIFKKKVKLYLLFT